MKTAIANVVSFFEGAKTYDSEPLFENKGQITVQLDESMQIVSNENGRSIKIRLNETTVCYASLAPETPIKAEYNILKLVAVRDADYKGRSIKKGHTIYRAN